MKMCKIILVIIGALTIAPLWAQSTGQPGQPNPVYATQMAGSDGTTLRTIKTDANGNIGTTAPAGASATQVQGTADTGTSKVGFPVLFGCQFNTTPATITTGQVGTVQCDNVQNLLVKINTPAPVQVSPTSSASLAITPVVTSAVASSLVLKASAGNLYSVTLTTGATAGLLMVFNATSAPADGAVTPVYCVDVAATSTVAINFIPGPPAQFATGITAVFSSGTNCFSKTASATAFISGMVQ
jgi:hypothetical protein